MNLKVTDVNQKLEYDFIQKLIKRRKELKISQQELADRAGVPQSTVARCEAMLVSPSLSNIIKFCKILNIELDYSIFENSTKHISLVVDMYGCPNRCMHCWLGNLPNHILSDTDARFLVDLFNMYFDDVTYYSWLREPDFTKDYRDRWLADNLLSKTKPQRFELASFYHIVRDKEYVKFLKEVGTKKVQLTFFGLKELTDKYVGRVGAFEELISATKILKESNIEPRWQIFINQENKDEIIKVINLGKEMNVKEIFVHEGSCDGNNKNLYNIRINKDEIPNEVIPYYLDYNERLTEKECTEILKKDETHFVPSFENDDIVINITSDFNAYFNYTNPSPKWLIGNILKDPFEGIVKKILNNDVEAINIAKKITLKELALKYGDINSNKVFSLDDYKMYLLNEHLSKLK